MRDLPKSLTAKFRLEKKIGAGGMGTIYRAVQIDLERPAAIKFLNVGVSGLEEELARFAAEARVCSQLKHPNVVQVYDFDTDCSSPYIVFEFIDGHSLKDEIDAQMSVSVARVCQMMALVCDGLHHAHEMGVIHRDIKPANILINESGVPKVADFGLAKMGSVTNIKTKTGVVLGTPVYLSPEQAAEKKLTSACDIYALGVVLYELLTGTPPIDGPNDMDILLKHVNWEPHPVSHFHKTLHRRFDEVVARCLAKEPGARYATAADLAIDLRQLSKKEENWDPTLKKVRLGCRKGILAKRPLKEVLAAERTKSTERKQRKKKRKPSVLASVSAELAKPESGRKLIQVLPVIVVLFFILLGVYSYFCGGQSTVGVTDFASKAIGVKSVALSFHSKRAWKDPRFRILESTTKESVPFSLGKISIAELNEQSLFHHEILVHDLSPRTEYDISFRRKDGSYSLPVRVKTLEPTGFDVKSTVKMNGDGSMNVFLESRIPFRAKVKGATIVEGKGLTTSLKLSLPKEVVHENEVLQCHLSSIDGGQVVFSSKGWHLLRQGFEAVYAAFMRERRSGDFYRMWQGEGGRRNQAFQDGGNRYSRAGNKGSAVITQFWQRVEQQLEKETAWFPPLAELTRSYGTYRSLCQKDFALREAVGRALLPLEVLQCMAEYYRLPINSKWETLAGEKSRPFPLRYERGPMVGLQDYPFHLLSGREAKGGNVLFDHLSPDFKLGDMTPEKKKRMSLLTMTTKLDVDGSKIKRAWLGVELLVPAIIVLPTVELNGKFLATYRSKASWWRDYYDAWVKGNYYDDVLVNLQKPLQGFGGIADVVVDSEKGKKGKSYHLFHEVSPQILEYGTNRALVRALFGPSDGAREPTVIGSITLYVEKAQSL